MDDLNFGEFDVSSLSSLSLRNSFDFYSSEASTLQDLLEVGKTRGKEFWIY